MDTIRSFLSPIPTTKTMEELSHMTPEKFKEFIETNEYRYFRKFPINVLHMIEEERNYRINGPINLDRNFLSTKFRDVDLFKSVRRRKYLAVLFDVHDDNRNKILDSIFSKDDAFSKWFIEQVPEIIKEDISYDDGEDGQMFPWWLRDQIEERNKTLIFSVKDIIDSLLKTKLYNKYATNIYQSLLTLDFENVSEFKLLKSAIIIENLYPYMFNNIKETTNVYEQLYNKSLIQFIHGSDIFSFLSFLMCLYNKEKGEFRIPENRHHKKLLKLIAYTNDIKPETVNFHAQEMMKIDDSRILRDSQEYYISLFNKNKKLVVELLKNIYEKEYDEKCKNYVAKIILRKKFETTGHVEPRIIDKILCLLDDNSISGCNILLRQMFLYKFTSFKKLHGDVFGTGEEGAGDLIPQYREEIKTRIKALQNSGIVNIDGCNGWLPSTKKYYNDNFRNLR